MLISTATLNALRVGVQTQFKTGFDRVSAVEEWWMALATAVNSNDASEVYRMNDTLFRLRERVGTRVALNAIEKSYTLVNREFEGTIEIRQNDVEDDKFGNYADQLMNLGRAARLWPNDLVYEAIVGGGAALCYDGQYFFDTDHPVDPQGAASSTQANLFTSTALTAANYNTVRTAMMQFLGNDNKPLNVMPSHLIVPPALEDEAKRILEMDLAGYLANASSTAVDSNVNKGTAKVMVIPDLVGDSSTTWYLADLNKPIKPFVMQFRIRPNRVDILNRPTDLNVFEDGIIRAGVRGRGASGYGLWHLISKCTA